MFYRPNSFWTWMLAVVTFTAAATALAMNVALYTVSSEIVSRALPGPDNPVDNPFYYSLVLEIFASVYQLLLLYDTLACRNTIQLIGLCIYAALLCVYAGLQIPLVTFVSEELKIGGILRIATSITAITGAFLAIICAVSWKVYGEFRWTVFQQFNGDLKLQKKYFTYQVFLTLLKFDLFFQIGYLVQILEVLARVEDQYFLSVLVARIATACIPLTVINTFVSAYWVRHESRVGMMITAIPSSLALIALSMYENVFWNLPYHGFYKWHILPYFGSITVVLTVVTLLFAIICTMNFGKGLKPYIASSRTIRNLEDEYEMSSMNLEDYNRVADC